MDQVDQYGKTKGGSHQWLQWVVISSHTIHQNGKYRNDVNYDQHPYRTDIIDHTEPKLTRVPPHCFVIVKVNVCACFVVILVHIIYY